MHNFYSRYELVFCFSQFFSLLHNNLISKLVLFTGQRLCLAEDKYIGGVGTYTRQGYIMSCLAGVVKITAQPDKVSWCHYFVQASKQDNGL